MKTKFLIFSLGLLFLGCLSCKKDDAVGTDSQEETAKLNAKKELDNNLKAELISKNITSVAYCVVENDKLLHSNAQGFADKANNRLATDSTRYLVASVSKIVTSVALMQLVEQNLIGLDDDINQFLPISIRNPKYADVKITCRMLLSHYSSIVDDHQNSFKLDCFGVDCPMTFDDYFRNVFVSNGDYFSPDNFSSNQPGAKRSYSNLASALVGYLVEKVSKTPFDVYCKNKIFIPLGMKKTEWRLANIPLNELAIPYSKEITSANPHYTFPDYPNGGLRTTVLDLSKFLRAIIGNGTLNGVQILSPASMTTMRTLQYGDTNQCLSFFYDTSTDRKLLGHTGGEKGVTSEMFYDVNTNVGVIIFANDEDAKIGTMSSLLYSYGEK